MACTLDVQSKLELDTASRTLLIVTKGVSRASTSEGGGELLFISISARRSGDKRRRASSGTNQTRVFEKNLQKALTKLYCVKYSMRRTLYDER